MAQYSHYFYYNTGLYNNFFHNQKKVYKMLIDYHQLNVSYKIERKNLGIELFTNHPSENYLNPLTKKYPQNDNTILYAYSRNYGIDFQYKINLADYFKINLFSGFIYSSYWDTYKESLYSTFERSTVFRSENKFGVVSGVNATIPIYKNFLFNSNVRYSFYPTGNYSTQLFVWEIGVGYKLMKKKELHYN